MRAGRSRYPPPCPDAGDPAAWKPLPAGTNSPAWRPNERRPFVGIALKPVAQRGPSKTSVLTSRSFSHQCARGMRAGRLFSANAAATTRNPLGKPHDRKAVIQSEDPAARGDRGRRRAAGLGRRVHADARGARERPQGHAEGRGAIGGHAGRRLPGRGGQRQDERGGRDEGGDRRAADGALRRPGRQGRLLLHPDHRRHRGDASAPDALGARQDGAGHAQQQGHRRREDADRRHGREHGRRSTAWGFASWTAKPATATTIRMRSSILEAAVPR